MTETARLKLPLVQAAQAQKHVTVNEAFLRVDALAQAVIASRSVSVPPPLAADGALYAVAAGASSAWAGQEGRLALWLNGGWAFLDPAAGWRAWITDEGVAALHDGTEWATSAVAASPGGAAFGVRVIEIDHAVSTGATSTTLPVVPQGAVVFGVTGRVLSDLGGTATGFALGVDGATDRYGSGIGTGAGAWFRGVTGTPVAYYEDTALLFTAEGGDFGGGMVRLAVHVAELGLPRV